MRKRWFAIIMTAILVCSAAGCGESKNPVNPDDGATPAPPTEAVSTPTRLADDDLKKELGVGELLGEPAQPDRETDAKTKTIYVKDYGAKGNGTSNDASAIRKAINALQKAGSGSVLMFEPNTTYYVSSGECALALQGLKNVTIKGENTTILAKSVMSHCYITNCNNVVVEGLNFDYETKPYAIGTVIENKKKGVVTVKTDRSLNISGTYAQPVGDFFGLVDRTDGRYHVGISNIKVVDAEENTYEITCNTVFEGRDKRIKMMADDGYKFIIPMPNIGQVIDHGFVLMGNRDVTMKNCNVWSAAKFMFYITGNEGIIKFDGLKITPAPGEEDCHMVGWRDGFHCKENRAQLVWENCKAEYLYDDIFNIAASMLEVKEISGSNVSLFWQETNSAYTSIRKNDVISFFDTQSGEFLGRGTVKKVSVVNNMAKVVLKEEVSGLKARSSCKAVVDTLAAPYSIIRNCDFHGTLRFRSPIYIADSKLFVNRMWLNVEAPWEGPITKDVLFSNCEFIFDNDEETFIHIDSYNTKWEKAKEPYSVKNIVFFHCKLRQSAVEIGEVEKNQNQVRFMECY